MYQFSILIPSWNNLGHLQLCINSIRKNSFYKNQVIVFVNKGKDGTKDWLASQEDIDYIGSDKNVGVCIAMYSCRPLIKSSYVLYLNDDMYVCPDWDRELTKEIESIGHDEFMLSATLIEPYASRNPNLVSIVNNFGDTLQSFREDDLLKNYSSLYKEDWSGSSWPPSVVSLRIWDIVGGYSIEFSPGMYSDPDFSMKLWKYGIRVFKGVGKSKVYHFQSKSTGRLKKNRGSHTFLMKWGITARVFYSHYLKMGKIYSDEVLRNSGQLSLLARLRHRIKIVYGVLWRN